MSSWPDQSGNKLNQTYVKGFLDISGGDITIRNNGSISIGKNATMNGNLNVGNNSILNGNVTIGQSTVPYLFYDFETIDICNNINNVIQVIPPPQLFVSNTLVVNNQKDLLLFKNGTYESNSSSLIPSYNAFNAFNGSNGNSNYWQSQPNYSLGNYIGPYYTDYYLSNGDTRTIPGEWLQISLPYPMILTKYSFLCNIPSQGPKTYVILGSSGGNIWTLITSNIVQPINELGGSPYNTNIPTTFNINNSQPLSYYRLVIFTIWPGSNSTSIQQWNLYGNPYTNTNGVITTNLLYNYSLKSYDALFSSNVSNMMDSTNFITGSSSVLLDGGNNSIVLPYFPVTNTGLSFSCWIRPTFPTTGIKLYSIFEFMNGLNIITLILNTSTGYLYWNIQTPITITTAISQNISITPSVWTHIAWTMTYDNGNNSTWQLYVNGVNVFSSSRQAYPITGDFFRNFIGRSSILNTTYPNNNYQDFFGSIDNFRAYNTVLTSFQIGSLYNVQKTLIVNNSLYYHYNDVFLGNKLAVLSDTSLNSNVTIYGTTASTSSTTGALIVSGGVGIGGNMNISSSTASTSSITGALTVTGGVGMGGNLYIGSTTESILTTNGSIVVSGGMGIAKNINMGGNLKIGAGSISTDLSSGSIIVSGGAAITGNLNIGGARTVIYSTESSISSTTGALTISGGLGMGGNLYVGSTQESSSTTIGAIVVSGGMGIAKNTNIGGDVKMGRNSTSFDLSSGSIIVSGGAAITGNVNIGGARTVIYSTAASTSSTTGALTISGGLGMGGNLYVGSTQESSSTSIGSLVVSGGMGIAKNTNIGGNLIVNKTEESTTTTNGSFVTYGGAGIGGKLNIGGNTKINASSASISTDTGALVVTGGVGMGGNLYVGGILTCAGLSSTIFNSPNNVLTTTNTPAYYLLGRLSGKNFKLEIISGANATITNTQAEIYTISGIISTDGSLSASYYTNGQNLVIDNIYFNKIGSGSGSTYDIYIRTTTNYAIQCHFNVYNINGNWTVNPTLNTPIISGTVTALTATWITLENYLRITSPATSTSSNNGAFVVVGGVGIGGNVNIGSSAISTDLSSGSFITKGGAAIAGNVNIGGARTVIYSTNPSTSSTTGALTISGGLGMGGNLYVGSTQESDSTTNGSLVVSGGVGIAKNANIGGDVKMGRNSISTNLSSGSLIVTGGAAITGNLNIGANTIIYSTASSISTSTGALTISGGIGIGENANIKGNLKVTGTVNVTGLMTCSGGLVTRVFTIGNNAITADSTLHNSCLYLTGTIINQFLPPILPNLSSIITIINKSNTSQNIVCSGSDSFDGSNFSGSVMSLPLGYSMRIISGGTKWFVDNYKFNNSQYVDTTKDQTINGNKTFSGVSSFNTISASGITDNGVLTTLQTVSVVNDITAGGIITGNRIIDLGPVTTIKSLSCEGTIAATGITDNGNTNLGTSNSNILTVNSLTKINGGISNKVFNLNNPIGATSALYGATIHFLSSITIGNINQRIPTAAITGGYNTTIFFVNYSTTTQIISSDGGNFVGQQVSSGANPNIALLSNYCFTLRSDGTNWSVQNTQHITNLPIDNTADQTIGGLKMFSSVLNVNGGIYYKNIPITVNNTVGNATWYGSTIDISNSTTWTTTLPSAANNTNMYIWNHSAVNQTINAFSGEGFFGYNITNNSTSISIPSYSMIAIRSTSTYTTKTWYVQPYIREGSFFMDNYSNQSFSGTKTFTGSSNFGTTTTDIMTVNAISNLKGGFYTTSLNYVAKTNDYDLWSNNHITFSSVNGTSPESPQLLPSIPNGKNVCFSIFNNTDKILYVGSQNSSVIYGKVSPTGALIVPLVGGKSYDFGVANIGQTYGVWVVKATHTAYEEVDIGTDQTIGGTKAFSTAITTPGIIIPNSGNLKKIVLYNSSTDLNQFTSFYGFGIGANILSYNVDSLNSNHIFYCANTVNSAATGYTELLKIGNAGIVANKDLTINAGNKIVTPAITLNGYDLGTTISALTGNVGGLPTLIGTNNWSGPNTFTQTVTAIAFNVTSDYRIKDDIQTLGEDFTIDNLKPVTYYNNQTKKQDIGLVAHELQEEYPFLVNGEKDGENYQSVNYNGLIGILIKEIQDLKSRIALLEQKER